MTAGQIPRRVLSMQSAHQQAPFECPNNQRRQFEGIDTPENLPLSLPLVNNPSETVKPGVKSSLCLYPQLGISIV
jgi:hypothetical protein